MKQKIMNLIKKDGMYFLASFSLFIVTLLIVTVTFKNGDYTLQIPNQSLYGLISYIVIFVLGIVGILIFRNIDKKQINLSKIYLIIVIPIGILYCIVNPLGRVPDEEAHARRALAISQGIFFPEATKDGQAYSSLNSKLVKAVTKSTTSYEQAWNKIMLPETDKTSSQWYTTMALYAPICHFPQAFGMFITRLFSGTIVVQAYAARLANFALSVFLIYKAIKLIPFKKHIVFFLGLLPITLNEIASMSSDALAISISLFYVCYILYLKYDKNKEKITKKDILILAISSITVALSKIVYLPLCLLLFILPKEKFETKNEKNIITITIFAFSVILNLIWLAYCSRFLAEFNPGVNSGEQVKFILTHPLNYLLILFRTMNVYNQTFIVSLCGEGLGHYCAQASVLFVFPCIILFAMLFFVNDEKDGIEFDLFTRLTFLFIFAAIILLIYTSLYVQWTPLKSPLIRGVQARYFLPILILTAIIFDNKKIVFNCKFNNRYLAAFMLFFNLNALSALTFTYMYDTVITYYVK